MTKKGFTLIELLVTSSIVAILVAISVANFQEMRSRAYDTQAMALVHDGTVAIAALNAHYGTTRKLIDYLFTNYPSALPNGSSSNYVTFQYFANTGWNRPSLGLGQFPVLDNMIKIREGMTFVLSMSVEQSYNSVSNDDFTWAAHCEHGTRLAAPEYGGYVSFGPYVKAYTWTRSSSKIIESSTLMKDIHGIPLVGIPPNASLGSCRNTII